MYTQLQKEQSCTTCTLHILVVKDLVYNIMFYMHSYSDISPVDIDLYNLKVVNASDKCITVMWDHPPNVTPGTLTYNMVLRDEKDFEYKWSTPNTQGTVCNLSPGTTYTFRLTSKSTDPSILTTRAGTTTLRIKTIGKILLLLSSYYVHASYI